MLPNFCPGVLKQVLAELLGRIPILRCRTFDRTLFVMILDQKKFGAKFGTPKMTPEAHRR